MQAGQAYRKTNPLGYIRVFVVSRQPELKLNKQRRWIQYRVDRKTYIPEYLGVKLTTGQIAGGINDVIGEAIGAIIPEKWKQWKKCYTESFVAIIFYP